MDHIGVSEWRKIFAAWKATMRDNRDYLITLDGVAGDSDLGLTMTDGFAAASASADTFSGGDIGMMIYYAGKAIMSNAPSSLGTLLGSGFLEAGRRLKGKQELPIRDAGQFFEAIEDNIMQRGHSAVGDKTFLDGIDPAVQTLKSDAIWKEGWSNALRLAAEAAEAGAENTKSLVAKHGRMAVRGEQSIGMLDPGAVVASLLVRAFYRALTEE